MTTTGSRSERADALMLGQNDVARPTRRPRVVGPGGVAAALAQLGDEDLAMLEVAFARAIVDLGRAPKARALVGAIARAAAEESAERAREVPLR
jgi:hypothetical protein